MLPPASGVVKPAADMAERRETHKNCRSYPAGSVAEFIVYPDGRIISTGFPSDRLIQGMCHDLHRCGVPECHISAG